MSGSRYSLRNVGNPLRTFTAREDFTSFSRRESFKFYMGLLSMMKWEVVRREVVVASFEMPFQHLSEGTK